MSCHCHEHHCHEEESGKLFDKEFFVHLGRILFSIILGVLTKIFVNHEQFFVLALVLYSVAIIVCLYDIFLEVIENIAEKRNPVDINLLLCISSIGVVVLASLIHYQVLPTGPFEIDILDAVIVVALYQVGELFEDLASKKSRNAIHSAIDLRAKTANLLVNDKIEIVDPDDLKVNDIIVINVGDKIPVDGIITSGSGLLDTSSLTGESMPVSVKENDHVLSGSSLMSGSLYVKVEKAYDDSTVSKIIELVEESGERKAKAEKFIDRFAKVYTPLVFIVGLVYVLVFGFVTNTWSMAVYGGLAILVVSCPCAIVVSVPLAFFAGIGLASKNGIIIKGGNFLDSLCNVKTLFIDKTGTLTYGRFEITEIQSKNKEELLECLYAAESRSNHPLAKAIVKDIDLNKYTTKIHDYQEFAGEGVKADFAGSKIVVGTPSFLQKYGISANDIDVNGTIIHVAKNTEYLGYVCLKDQIKEDSVLAINNIKKLGIKVVLLSGDKESIVKEVSNQVGINGYYYGLLPADKTKYLEEEISKNNGLVAFAGDGINDTPSIVRADIGIAMGNISSDIVVENADVVLMKDSPNKIYEAIKVAKKTKRVAIFNIVVSLLVKTTVIALILTGVLKQFGMLVAVLADTGLSVLMILNSLLLFYRKIS